MKKFFITRSLAFCFLISCCMTAFCSASDSYANSFKKVSGTVPDSYSGEIDSKNSFFSLISRMRYVERWSVLKNSEKENLESHSFEVAVIAHALAVIRNEKFGGHVDENKVAVLGLFHDVLEIITGDAPTPTKYFDPEMKKMYTKLEEKVSEEMLEKIEDKDIRKKYSEVISPSFEEDGELKEIVKSADDISALIKCLREKRNGNSDFDKAYERLFNKVNHNDREEVKYFVEYYLGSFYPSEQQNKTLE